MATTHTDHGHLSAIGTTADGRTAVHMDHEVFAAWETVAREACLPSVRARLARMAADA